MIKVVLQGLGPIGQNTAKLILKDHNLKIVGALEINPQYVGADLGTVLGITPLGIRIENKAKALFKKTKPDVLVLATNSSLDKIMPLLKKTISSGINIVSPAEELFYPEFINEEKYKEINQLAKEHQVRVLGGAVNPGCLMDKYPLKIHQEKGFAKLKSITVYRWDNTIARRLPLLKKTGAGLDTEEFHKLDQEDKLGHVGLKMSAAYLADKIGLQDYKINFKREPIITEQKIKPEHGDEIAKGKIAGLKETCSVTVDGEEKVILDLRMFVGAINKNSVEIRGEKGQSEVVDYSNIVNGDIATIRILKEAISHVVEGPPGLNQINYVPDPLILLTQ